MQGRRAHAHEAERARAQLLAVEANAHLVRVRVRNIGSRGQAQLVRVIGSRGKGQLVRVAGLGVRRSWLGSRVRGKAHSLLRRPDCRTTCHLVRVRVIGLRGCS